MTVLDPNLADAPRARLAPPQRPDPLRWRRIAAGVSVLVHAIAIALLLFAIPRPPVELSADPSVEIVYDNATATAASTSPVTDTEKPADQVPERPPTPDVTPPDQATPAPTPAPPTPAPPTPAPPTPPEPEAVPLPIPPEVAPAPPEPTPPDPTPSQPMPPVPEPPVPEPATRSVPVVRLQAPEAPEPAPTTPEFRPPTPPPPLPPPYVPPLPRPPAPPRLVERPRAPPGFPPPIDLSYGQGPAAPPSRPLTGPGSRSIDLTLGAPKPGPNRQEAFYDERARKIGADWANGLNAWWLAHRYYPRQAIENGDDGSVKIELTVNRSGRVEQVSVVGRSGSPFLDMAALSVWRGAQLAPFPAENPKERETMEITINYLLIR